MRLLSTTGTVESRDVLGDLEPLKTEAGKKTLKIPSNRQRDLLKTFTTIVITTSSTPIIVLLYKDDTFATSSDGVDHTDDHRWENQYEPTRTSRLLAFHVRSGYLCGPLTSTTILSARTSLNH